MSGPPSRESRFPFADRPRLWGVAVSHYQVEGNDSCDWTAWEASGKTRGGPCGGAAGSWEQYESDADLAASAGSNAFRFSISWSRVEPRPGEWNDDALDRYARFVEHLVARGIEPVVTLFHYTHPTWFHERTPWTSPASVDRFRKFAAMVARRLGDSVRAYTIFNEPLVFVLAGFLDGQIPPGLADSRAAAKALDHIFAAHAAAAAEIRAMNPTAAIGIAHNMMSFAPDRWWNPLDRLVARVGDRFYNASVFEAMITGEWSLWLPPAIRFRGKRPELAGSLDFAGVNFYSRLHLRCPGHERLLGDYRYDDRTGIGLTDNGWEIVPDVLPRLLRIAGATNLPVVVTENGLADGDDRLRARFLREHVAAIRDARRLGTDVHGYFHWSLVDNYEWLDGFEPRFGLFAVDQATMARRARPSSALFRDLGHAFLRGE
ncbi:MAG: glycoside hydrolase family 1 protein [Acidobacteria bacterium]|nr:glycoside hydrolase family 1 protein [Acidobacteriota bacterium]